MTIHKLFLTAGLLAGFALLTTLLSLTAPVHAEPNATITVNSAADPGDGTCNAQNCTLREAITLANSTVGVQDTIGFNISYSSSGCNLFAGYCTIKPATELPAITDPVIIDGYTQPGTSPNTLAVGDDAELKIMLDGQGNAIHGLQLNAGNSIIKGLVVSDFGLESAGIYIHGSDNNVIQGNFIGTNVTGDTARANDFGIGIGDSNMNLIGGTLPEARNLISGNGYGILITGGSKNLVQGNYIGTDRDGLNALPNAQGITLWDDATENTIGGKGAGARNIISGNSAAGLVLSGASTNVVRGNYIGLSANQNSLGNSNGITLVKNSFGTKFAQNNTVTRNRISGNASDGIVIGQDASDTSFGNTFTRNVIYGNGGLGIDIFPTGQNNANDALDPDDGPNQLQNYPTVNKVTSAGSTTTIKGKLNSEPNKSYRIEFFVNSPCEDNNHGEGKKYFGAVTVTTNGSGNAKFTFTKSKALAAGAGITATATELVSGTPGSTSEFSNCKN